MKNPLLLTCIIMLLASVSFAQPVIDTEGGGGSGINIMSIGIGLIIGLVVGYFVGSKMSKK